VPVSRVVSKIANPTSGYSVLHCSSIMHYKKKKQSDYLSFLGIVKKR
jgi:hypothetical protein